MKQEKKNKQESNVGQLAGPKCSLVLSLRADQVWKKWLEESNSTVKNGGPDSSVSSFFITEWKLESSTRTVMFHGKKLEMMPSVAANIKTARKG